MGFGVMFVGVFFLWSAKILNFDVLPDFIGYLIILYGIKCATRYCNNFKKARVAAVIAAVVSFAVFATQGLGLLGIDPLGDDVLQIIEAANQASRIAFIMILLTSIFGLAKETGAEKTEKRSLISVIAVPVLWLGYIVIGVMNYLGAIGDEKFLAAALLCEIVYVLLTAVAVFSAYMWICVEGDEDMPKRNNIKSPMDYFDRRRESEAAEKAEAAKNPSYQSKKKKKKGR